MNQEELINLLLPEGISDYFCITKIEKGDVSCKIHLDEINAPPSGYNRHKLHSKGFYEPITIQDFPLRGKPCYLKVRRRRWRVGETGDIVSRDWDIVAKGTRMTKEFASFLKEINRYVSGKLQ